MRGARRDWAARRETYWRPCGSDIQGRLMRREVYWRPCSPDIRDRFIGRDPGALYLPCLGDPTPGLLVRISDWYASGTSGSHGHHAAALHCFRSPLSRAAVPQSFSVWDGVCRIGGTWASSRSLATKCLYWFSCTDHGTGSETFEAMWYGPIVLTLAL